MKFTAKDKKAVEEYRKKVEWLLSVTHEDIVDTEDTKAARIKRAKIDYRFMIKTYFSHIAECECGNFQIELANKVKRNQTFKGFAEWPRGFAKSVHCTIFIPFWLHINDQSWYYLQISNSFDAASDLLDDLRAELEANHNIIRDFGEQKVIGKKWERGYFITGNGYIGRALGVGQKVRGLRVGNRRPDFCEADDMETEEINKNPMRQDEQARWIERSLIPTMTGKFRRFLFSNNRWAKRMIQTVLQDRHKKWFVHHIKAYDPVTLESNWDAMYPKEYWEAQIIELGTLVCQAEYNQEPHTEGKIFTDKLLRYDIIPRLDHFDHILAYWDVAYSDKETADYNAVRIWGMKNRHYYLVKAFVRQCKMFDAIEWMFYYHQQLPESVHINFYYESQFWNDALQMVYDQVAEKHGHDIPLITDDRKKPHKYDRILGMLPYYQQGRIIYNKREKSSNDMQEGTAQLKGIEPGYKGHDDSPDADEGALHKLNRLYVPKDMQNKVSYGAARRTGRY
jgi:hypothetical protein